MSQGMKKVQPSKILGAVEITVFKCLCRCGHEWITREAERPRVCPKCKSANWDRPKQFDRSKNNNQE
jgi:predicted Zn-ribbon and HTH transcriptional regulator